MLCGRGYHDIIFKYLWIKLWLFTVVYVRLTSPLSVGADLRLTQPGQVELFHLFLRSHPPPRFELVCRDTIQFWRIKIWFTFALLRARISFQQTDFAWLIVVVSHSGYCTRSLRTTKGTVLSNHTSDVTSSLVRVNHFLAARQSTGKNPRLCDPIPTTLRWVRHWNFQNASFHAQSYPAQQ